MDDQTKKHPSKNRGPVPISEIVPQVLADILARAQAYRAAERAKNDFRKHVPNIKLEDLIPN